MVPRGRRKPEFSEQALSRRERQIMAAVYRLGRASIAEIAAELPEPPTVDAVRRMAHILEEKGLLDHDQDGPRNVYYATIKLERASRSALDHLMETFFADSPQKLVAALLDSKKDSLSAAEMKRLATMIDDAIQREKQS